MLNDPKKSFAAKMTMAVERSNLIGVTNPDEQAYKWLLSMLDLAGIMADWKHSFC